MHGFGFYSVCRQRMVAPFFSSARHCVDIRATHGPVYMNNSFAFRYECKVFGPGRPTQIGPDIIDFGCVPPVSVAFLSQGSESCVIEMCLAPIGPPCWLGLRPGRPELWCLRVFGV